MNLIHLLHVVLVFVLDEGIAPRLACGSTGTRWQVMVRWKTWQAGGDGSRAGQQPKHTEQKGATSEHKKYSTHPSSCRAPGGCA